MLLNIVYLKTVLNLINILLFYSFIKHLIIQFKQTNVKFIRKPYNRNKKFVSLKLKFSCHIVWYCKTIVREICPISSICSRIFYFITTQMNMFFFIKNTHTKQLSDNLINVTKVAQLAKVALTRLCTIIYLLPLKV